MSKLSRLKSSTSDPLSFASAWATVRNRKASTLDVAYTRMMLGKKATLQAPRKLRRDTQKEIE